MCRLKYLIPVALLSLVLVGCEQLRETFGYRKQPPDEFLVITKSPLVIPPDYSLRPPRTTPSQSDTPPPNSAARAALLGKDKPALGEVDDDVTDGEKQLLEESGASVGQDSIRTVIENEMRNVVPLNRVLVETLAQPPSP